MRWVFLLFVFLFLFSFVSAGSTSDTWTNFTIDGCQEGMINLPLDTCSSDGFYYCGDSADFYKTLYDNKGCSREQDVPGQAPCCPFGYECRDDGDGQGLVCHLWEVECSNFTDEGTCTTNDCFWIDSEGICVSDPRDFSCSLYKTELTCEEDIFNLGQRGEGTQDCGTYFVVGDNIPYRIGNCHCEWIIGASGNECKLAWTTSSTVYNGISDSFECSKSFGMSECIDGVQDINWSTFYTNLTGSFALTGIVPDDILVAAGCKDGASNRDCGEPLVKLSGFSFFSLILSFFVIFLFYFKGKRFG